MKSLSQPLSTPLNLTETLLRIYPAVELDDLWLPPQHCIEGGRSIGLSLGKLDQVLKGEDLAALHPTVLSKAVRKRQLTFIGGRLCAEHIAAELGYPNAIIGRRAKSEPVWPEGLHGSITHTDDLAYAAAIHSRTCNGLGIDSEWMVGHSGLESIMTMCCTDLEKRQWLDGEAAPLIAILIFSAKEAGYKAIYNKVKRFIDFIEFEVTELRWNTGQLILSPVTGSELEGVIPPLQVRFRIQQGEKMLIHTLAIV